MPKNGFHPTRWTRIVLDLVAVFFLFTACSPPAEKGVQLLLGTETLQPTSTFELRFDVAVVSANQVGLPATNSPLVFHPPLPGKFVWLSQRSGVFTPTHPLALGKTYQARLAPGLKNASGEPLGAALNRRLQTPPFALVAVRASALLPSTNAPAEPLLQLEFNADVTPKQAEDYLEFRRGHLRIRAEVRQGGEQDHISQELQVGTLGANATWAPPVPALPLPAPLSPDENSLGLLPNRLVVTPAEPLTPGGEWALVVKKGLPTSNGELKLVTPSEVVIGTVQPFTVASVEPHNNLSSGKRITVRFSKPVSPALSTNAAQWLAVNPAPRDLRFETHWNEVSVKGSFLVGTNYALEVRQGLPAQEAFKLDATLKTNGLVFDKVPPRLYFPTFEGEQLGWGNREFHVLSVNVPRIRVRAKRLDRHHLIHALTGYRDYFRRHNHEYDPEEPYQRLDYNLLAGESIFERSIPINPTLDLAEKTILNWDDILGVGKFGAVFLDAQRAPDGRAGEKLLGAQAVLQVTDLGLVWKKAREKVFVYVFSLHTGAPYEKASVRLLSDENQVMAEAVTDASGSAQFTNSANAEWLMAETGADLHAVALGDYGLPLYSFGIPIEWSDERATQQAFLFSDRTVYRPGETLLLKAICRELGEHGLANPGKQKAVLSCFDSKGHKFYETNLWLSSYGSLSHALPLPAGPLGGYRAEVALGDRSYHHSFSLLEYHPGTFEIECASKPVYAAGEKPAFAVSGRYFMGKPLAKAHISWVLQANDTGFRPEGFEEFTFCSDGSLHPLERSAASLSLSGEAHTLSNLVLAPEITFNPKAPQPRASSLELVVTDLDQQTLTKTIDFLCHSSEFYFGLKRPKDVLEAGHKLPLDFAVIRADGTPVSESLMATVRVSRVEWQSVRVKGAGRSAVYRSEPITTNLFERLLPSRGVAHFGGKWDWAETGAPAAEFTLAEPGFYVVETESRDRAGRPVLSAYGVYVYGKESLGWNYRNPAQIDLVPQEKSYRPGQNAVLLVKTPISGQALVTVERDRVLRSFVTKLEGNSPIVEVPLLDTDAPNVLVSVMLLRGSAQSARKFKQPEYRLGYCQVQVEKPEIKLNVAVRPGTDDYLPGEYVQVETFVRDASGKPVPDAEVTLYAVDEGVLSLTDYQKPDPLGYFYRPRGLAVRTSLSLPNLLPEDPEQLQFFNKGYLVGGGGLMNRLRKNFVSCAFWDGNLRTDKDGQVQVRFRAPDNLTRYRLMAIAQTEQHQFGAGESAFQVNKSVMLEPVLPRFANVGDKLIARALLLSRHPVAGEVEVSLALDGKAVTTNHLSARVPLPANGSAFLEIPLEFKDVGNATWTWTARFFENPGQTPGSPRFFVDSVQTSIPVGYPVPLLREIHLSRVDTASTNLLQAVNPQLLEGSGTITVSVSNTRLSELGEAVSQVLHYPYGCAEQTGSSLLPWLVLQGLQDAVPQINKAPAEVSAAIRGGVQRLLSMQTSSGGLSYWPGQSEPMFFGSAYGGMVLALAAQRGYALPRTAWDQLADYLATELRQTRNTDDPHQLSARCLALYALALGGRAEAGLHEVLYQKRQLLGAEGRALLALAIAESKGPESMLRDLLQSSAVGSVPAQDWFGCEARELALQLLAWLRLEPSAPQVDVLVSQLMQWQQKGHWSTTQGNAWALFALSDYARQVEGTLESMGGTLGWGTQQVDFRLAGKASSFRHTFAINPEPATMPLTVRRQGKSRLFTQVVVEARPRVFDMPRQERGHSNRRTYTRLDEANKPLPMEELRVGDRVLITLDFQLREPAHFLAIDDPLPAILEAVHPEFKTQGTSADLSASPDWVSDFRELRKDRALFFRNHLGPGSYKIQYLARVRAAGLATAPATKIEEMYHPERFGVTETTRLESRALD